MPVPVYEVVGVFVKNRVEDGDGKAWENGFDEFLVVFGELDVFGNHGRAPLG